MPNLKKKQFFNLFTREGYNMFLYTCFTRINKYLRKPWKRIQGTKICTLYSLISRSRVWSYLDGHHCCTAQLFVYGSLLISDQWIIKLRVLYNYTFISWRVILYNVTQIKRLHVYWPKHKGFAYSATMKDRFILMLFLTTVYHTCKSTTLDTEFSQLQSRFTSG